MMSSNPWREGFEAIMFRTVNDQPTLWDSILPAELLVSPVELDRVVALLEDPVFFAPFRGALRCSDRSSVDPDGNLPAVDVSEVPLPAGLRVVVPGSIRFGRASVERDLHDLGVRSVAIPRMINRPLRAARSNTGVPSARR
jgi:hypothetical protein